MGPSIAEGSQGWNPKWADFPAATSTSPIRGRFEGFRSSIKICFRSHVFELNRNHAIDIMNQISPMRLYKIAWGTAVFLSAHPYHHPMSRKDIIPTPSHPIKSWKRLLTVTRISMVMRKRSRYLEN